MAEMIQEETALNTAVIPTNVTTAFIQGLVYTVRGQQIMLDSDLALLYQVETRVLNQAVSRNSARFPAHFRFQLTEEETENLTSQIVMSSSDGGHGGRRRPPYGFTEQGIAMLSAVLRSDVAIQISIRIMETFVEMRKYMANTSMLCDRMTAMEVRQFRYQSETEERLEKILDYIAGHEESRQTVFFDGQIYDAFELLVRLVESATHEIVLVDNYVDVDTLNIFAKKNDNVHVQIYTTKNTKLTETDVSVFNQQYPRLDLYHTKVFHDRFMIIDNQKAYHIGASLKDAGKKCFAISLLEDVRMIQDILQRLGLEND